MNHYLVLALIVSICFNGLVLWEALRKTTQAEELHASNTSAQCEIGRQGREIASLRAENESLKRRVDSVKLMASK